MMKELENYGKVKESTTNTRQTLLFRVVSPNGDEVKFYPPHFKVPRNLTVCIGIPKRSDLPIRVAFCRYGGSIPHDTLKPVAAPSQDYESFNAFLVGRKNGEKKKHVLIIIKMSERDSKLLENQGIEVKDPFKALKQEPVLKGVLTALKADDYQFQEDENGSNSIDPARQQVASHSPKCGLARTVWMDNYYPGG